MIRNLLYLDLIVNVLCLCFVFYTNKGTLVPPFPNVLIILCKPIIKCFCPTLIHLYKKPGYLFIITCLISIKFKLKNIFFKLHYIPSHEHNEK